MIRTPIIPLLCIFGSLAWGGPSEAEGFVARRAALLESLAAARDATPGDEPRAILDLAELHLREGLIEEAASFLAAVDGPPLPAAEAERLRALRAAAASLGAEGPAPSLAEMRGLRDARLFQAHALALRGRDAAAVAALAHDPAVLGDVGPHLRARLLPVLLRAAIRADREDVADDLEARLSAAGGRAPPGALAVLRAERARRAGRDAEADAHLAGARHAAGPWGHLARMRLLEGPGEADGGEGRTLAVEARALWNGDPAHGAAWHAARAARARGDDAEAIETLAAIWWAGRDPEVAAELLDWLSDYYAAASGGDVPLAAHLADHARIAARVRWLPGYAALSEGHADALAARGATAAAASEYAATRAHLAAGAAFGLWPEDPAWLDGLRLKEAAAHLAGGREARALALLRDPLRAARPADAARRAALLAAGGAPIDEGALPAAATAQAHLRAGRWTAAARLYGSLLRGGGAMRADDLLGALLAAHRADAPDVAAEAERALAARGGPAARVARGGFVPMPPAPGTLGADGAAAALERAEAALALADEIMRPADVNPSLRDGP